MTEIKRRVRIELSNGDTVVYHDLFVGPWLTVAQYQKEHKLNIATIKRWLKDGTIPSDKKVEIPELDGLTMIRNEKFGTARNTSRENGDQIIKMYQDGFGPTQLSKIFNCSRHTIISIIRRHKEKSPLNNHHDE